MGRAFSVGPIVADECTPIVTNHCIRPFVQIRDDSWAKFPHRIWMGVEHPGEQLLLAAEELEIGDIRAFALLRSGIANVSLCAAPCPVACSNCGF